MTLNSRYKIKIPDNIELLYSPKNNLMVVIGKLGKKTLKCTNKIFFYPNLKLIEITHELVDLKVNRSKNKKAYQGTSLALLKQTFLEVSLIVFKKLRLVGIGYKVFIEKFVNNQFLILKLGYSHNIYFKIPNNIKIECLKSDKIFISGFSYTEVTQVASTLKAYKFPEIYKGKGILYENEKLLLKEGKKI